jgi:hypothetical protein
MREMELLKLQISSLNGSNSLVPIIFSGSSGEIGNMIEKFEIKVTAIQTIGDQSTQIDKKIVKGFMNYTILERILHNISNNSTGNEMNSIAKIGFLPNSGISESESEKISKNIDEFMIDGLKKIISEKNGVKESECRSTIIYNDI